MWRKRSIMKKIDYLLEELDSQGKSVFLEFLHRWQTEGIKFYSKLQHRYDSLLQVIDLNKQLNLPQTLESMLTTILDKAIRLSQAERGFILLGTKGQVFLARNFDQEGVHNADLKISRSIAELVLVRGERLLTADAQGDPALDSASSRTLGLRSVACFPLQSGKKTLGALYLDNRFCLDAFSEDGIFILQAFADQASLAISQAYLLEYNEVEKNTKSKKVTSTKIQGQPKKDSKIQEQLSGISRFGKMISGNTAMNELFSLAAHAAQSKFPILITGESGTGKSILAQAIHSASERKQEKFMEENCAAITDSLLESELFGYVRGAFTGAYEDQKGILESAHKGTLFLDEVGDMSVSMQGKLLKVLENKLVRPVGGNHTTHIDIRLITATHRNLSQLVAEKKFREDLWYRLKVITLHLPALRERPNDIPILCRYFLSHDAEALSKGITEIDSDAMNFLIHYSWPGNIRQLEHELKRMVALKRQGIKLMQQDLSSDIVSQKIYPIPSDLPLKEAVRRFEANYIRNAVHRTNGNKSKAAKILGLSRRALYNKIGDRTTEESSNEI